MNAPKSYYVYELSYPDAMPGEMAGVVFYVGKGTNGSRMDDHFREASKPDNTSKKCLAIRSIWDAGLAPVRRIVFETLSEVEALQEEVRRIQVHQSPYLTNVKDYQMGVANHPRPKPLTERRESISTNVAIDNWRKENAIPSTKFLKECFAFCREHPGVSILHEYDV